MLANRNSSQVLPISSYCYTIQGDRRTFHHLWTLNDNTYECETCRSTCNITDCFSLHWPPCSNQSEPFEMSREQELDMERIYARNITTFVMKCLPRFNRKEFVRYVGTKVLPQLLRQFFTRSRKLKVRITFHIRLGLQQLLFTSSKVTLRHHYDIDDMIDMTFTILLKKILSFVEKHRIAYGNTFFVACIKIKIVGSGRLNGGRLALPLRYVDKITLESDVAKSNAKMLTKEYQKYLIKKKALPLNWMINLYGFRKCASTGELFATHQYVRNDKMDFWQTPSYAIITDVRGTFRQIVPILNLENFLRKVEEEDIVYRCRHCKLSFKLESKFVWHEILKCGRMFKTTILDPDSLEFHASCLQLHPSKGSFDKVLLYGVLPL